MPMLQMRRGTGLPGGIVDGGGRDGGIEIVLSAGFRGLGEDDSVSEDVSGGVGSARCFFACFRASRLLGTERRFIKSLTRNWGAGIVCGSEAVGARAVGLATCARVGAFDIVAEMEDLR